MKNKLCFCFTVVSLGISIAAFSQNVGINTSGTPADNSSMLDVSAMDKGILIPRVILDNVANATSPINAPATGLLVFNTNAAIVGGSGVGFYYWSGTAWTKMATGNFGATLTNGRIWIGDGSGVPVERQLGGDGTISNTGVLDLSDNAVETSEINNLAVTTAKIADNAVDGTKINIASNSTGDLMYYNGTDWVRLQAGTPGQVLRANGAAAPDWANPSDIAVTSIATNNGITGGTITSTGTIGLTGQALALHNLGNNGLIVRTGAGTVTSRSIGISGLGGVAVTNGDGVSGNPTINLDYGNMLSGGARPVGNFGQFQNHSTYTDFNVTPNYWGWNYVQGATNAPNGISSQWYRENISLGSEYPGRGAGGYSLELAYPRYSASSAGVWMRTVENGVIGAWTRIDAGAIGPGTTNYISKWTAVNTLGNSQIFDNGTNVGVGTALPTGGKLEVVGPATGSGPTIRASGGGDVVLNTGGSLFFDGNYSYAGGNYIRPIGGNNSQGFFTSGAERMRITSTGTVGIGATGPLVLLSVGGNGTNVYNTSAWIENNLHVQGNETLNQGGRGRLRVGTAWNYIGLYAETSSTGANNDLVLGASSALVRIGSAGSGQNLRVSGLQGTGNRLVTTNNDGQLGSGIQMLYGSIDADGYINNHGYTCTSCGYSITVLGGGRYRITFATPFTGTPTVNVTQHYPSSGNNWFGNVGNGGSTLDNALTVAVTSTYADIKVGDGGGNGANRSFNFIVIGPR